MCSAAQRLILGFEKPYLDSQTRELLRDRNVGGVILFDNNIESLEQLAGLTKEIRAHCPTRPFIAIDFEGGRVRRGSNLFSPLEAPNFYLEKGLEKLQADCRKIADGFRMAGINLNYAPVADLTYQPGNPALTGRTYSDDCMAVADYCRVFIEAFSGQGVHCCLKHFPGLGSAANDPHEKYSVSCMPAVRLLNYDLVPFKAGIQAGAAIVMTTHMLATAYDSKLATFSPKIIELVRNIGFDGIITTDDMTMGAIAGDELPENVLEALIAGHDMAIICRACERHMEIIDLLDKNFNKLKVAGHETALKRIENARQKLP